MPSTQREVFDALATAKLITDDTARQMGAVSSLRNRIAHAYGDLDPVRMVRDAPVGLGHVQRLLDELAPTLAST